MSVYLRSIDPNHLISIGSEGYWGAYSPDIQWNPNAGTNGGGWVPLSGQNFTNQTANPDISFAVRAPPAPARAHGVCAVRRIWPSLRRGWVVAPCRKCLAPRDHVQ
jgi:hypothetical protein